MKENTLMAIDNITNTTVSSEVHVCECLAEFYSKAFLIMGNYQGTDINNFSLFQESEIIDKAIGKDKENENVITKITHFIPRLIQAIIDTIKAFIKKFRYQRHRRIEQKEIQKAMALQLVSDPKYIEDKLEKIGCKGKMSLREKMLSVKIFDMKHGVIRNGLSNLNSKIDVHPNTFDRMTVSYELAKQLLDSGEVRDPQLKEYLDYIVDVNSAFPTKERILTKRQIKKHAPTYTDDMNDTVNDLVKSLKIDVTEYMTIDTSDDDVIYQE